MRAGLLLLPIALGVLAAGTLAQDGDGNYGVIDDRSPQERAQENRPAGRLEIPRNDGWVTDLAGMLTPAQEQELEALMESFKQGSTHEIALLTVPSLRGEPIERFALEVARAWGMGTKEKSNAALLVVSKEDRLVRIEVGRGLEGTLTDSISGRIIRNVIVPEFRKGNFAEGLKLGVLAIHEAIGGQYGRLERRSSGAPPWVFFVHPLFLFVLVAVMIIVAVRRALPRRRRSRWFPASSGSGGSSVGGLGGFGGGRSSGGGGGFSGFGGGGGFSGGGATGRW